MKKLANFEINNDPAALQNFSLLLLFIRHGYRTFKFAVSRFTKMPH